MRVRLPVGEMYRAKGEESAMIRVGGCKERGRWSGGKDPLLERGREWPRLLRNKVESTKGVEPD